MFLSKRWLTGKDKPYLHIWKHRNSIEFFSRTKNALPVIKIDAGRDIVSENVK